MADLAIPNAHPYWTTVFVELVLPALDPDLLESEGAPLGSSFNGFCVCFVRSCPLWNPSWPHAANRARVFVFYFFYALKHPIGSSRLWSVGRLELELDVTCFIVPGDRQLSELLSV